MAWAWAAAGAFALPVGVGIYGWPDGYHAFDELVVSRDCYRDWRARDGGGGLAVWSELVEDALAAPQGRAHVWKEVLGQEREGLNRD